VSTLKLPEPLFVIINPTIRLILRSPLHGILSKDLMLITFKGRRSLKTFTTPVRYIAVDGRIRCFTSQDTAWWRNLRGGADVTLRIQGQDRRYSAIAIENEPEKTRAALIHYLRLFPQDAAYHDIKLNSDKSLNAVDLENAVKEAIVVEATLL
jgi:hypothetical protein